MEWMKVTKWVSERVKNKREFWDVTNNVIKSMKKCSGKRDGREKNINIEKIVLFEWQI